jgi:hypothetical protein
MRYGNGKHQGKRRKIVDDLKEDSTWDDRMQKEERKSRRGGRGCPGLPQRRR